MKKDQVVVDLFKMNEDQRIKYIADFCIATGQTKFMVDMPVPEGRGKTMTKEQRYLEKLKKHVNYEVVERHENCPVEHVVTVTIRRLTDA